MKEREDIKSEYGEKLTALVNTRLMFNTMSEMETYLDNFSLHSNGVKRSYSSPIKMRQAYRDLRAEAQEITGPSVDLNRILDDYYRADAFYRLNLQRCTNPQEISRQLLTYLYLPGDPIQISKRNLEIFEKVRSEHLSVTILFLRLIKVLPGYNSKPGDIHDIEQRYTKTLNLLSELLDGRNKIDQSGLFHLAREEEDKTLFRLINYVSDILSFFKEFSDAGRLYRTMDKFKSTRVALNLDGYWNEEDGTMKSTCFWQICATDETGVYFAKQFHKTHENKLIRKVWTWVCCETEEEDIMAVYISHPDSVSHLVKGKRIDERHHCTYYMETPHSAESIQTLTLDRGIPSVPWPQTIHLTRVTDPVLLDIYKNWQDTLSLPSVQETDAVFEIERSIYAITIEDIYVLDPEEECFYKVPIACHEGLDQVKLSDVVGILRLDGEKYLVFDEICLYIRIDDDELRQLGIQRVENIE